MTARSPGSPPPTIGKPREEVYARFRRSTDRSQLNRSLDAIIDAYNQDADPDFGDAEN